MEELDKYTVLVVEDSQTNIFILVEALGSEYEVSVVMDGKSALKAVDTVPPDLILLDVVMPGMDGYEVCKVLKSRKKTKDIPVIFVTGMSKDEDESKGFELGAVDYITKPISTPIVKARVKTHLQLRNAQKKVQELLKETLAGSINVLTEILSFSNPIAFSHISRIKHYVQLIVNELDRSDAWQFKLSAMLSQLGCVTLPPATLNKIYMGISVTEEEQRMFDSHPSIGSNLLAKIPGLESVSKIVSKQHESIKDPFNIDHRHRDPVVLGSQILKLAIDYDKEITLGHSPNETIKKMEKQKSYDPFLLSILAEAIQIKPIIKMVSVVDLKKGMTIDEDIFSRHGELVMSKGTEINSIILNFLNDYLHREGVRQPFRVLIPRK